MFKLTPDLEAICAAARSLKLAEGHDVSVDLARAFSPASPPKAPTKSTSRLLTLPAELRNQIYELAFEPENALGEEVNLFAAEAPSNSLLLTCRQIHSEAGGLYTSAYRRFWTENSFVAHQRALHKKRLGKSSYQKFDTITVSDLSKLRDADIEHITKLTIHVTPTIYTLADSRGSWDRTTLVPSRQIVAPAPYARPFIFCRYSSRKDGTVGDLRWYEGPDVASSRKYLDRLSQHVTVRHQLLSILLRKVWD